MGPCNFQVTLVYRNFSNNYDFFHSNITYESQFHNLARFFNLKWQTRSDIICTFHNNYETDQKQHIFVCISILSLLSFFMIQFYNFE